MKIAKTFGAVGALIAAALIGGTLISSVAAESPSGTADTDPGPYCQSFHSHLADELGTDASGLESAFRSAATATVDEAVAAGDLSAERAAAIKERLAKADLDGCAGLGRRLLRHPAMRAGRMDVRSAAADALGMQPSDLAAALRSGSSLEEVAEDQGVAYEIVKTAVLDSATTDLDKAVAAGRITADQEQARLDRLEKALDAGTWPPRGRRAVPAKPAS
jgi:hypothetical protein